MENKGFRNKDKENETEGEWKHQVYVYAHPVTSQTSTKQKYAVRTVSSKIAFHSYNLSELYRHPWFLPFFWRNPDRKFERNSSLPRFNLFSLFHLHFTTKLNFELLTEFYAYSFNFFQLYDLILTTATVPSIKKWVYKMEFERVPNSYFCPPYSTAHAQRECRMSIIVLSRAVGLSKIEKLKQNREYY